MIEFTPWSALSGGALIGLSAVLLMRLNGRIAGISGILNGVISGPRGDRVWRLAFVGGLVLGGVLYQFVAARPLLTRTDFPVAQLILAGALVGFGTRVGSGCTSGHGVCGVARLSPRSLAATTVFLAVGMVTATTSYWLLKALA